MKLNTWHNSSNNGGSCVEVMETTEGEFLVRDTKDGGKGAVHRYNRTEWLAFVSGVRNGEYDPAAETTV